MKIIRDSTFTNNVLVKINHYTRFHTCIIIIHNILVIKKIYTRNEKIRTQKVRKQERLSLETRHESLNHCVTDMMLLHNLYILLLSLIKE